MILNNTLAWKIFCWGVDYGQLTMEKERENEELFDAFICYNHAQKTAMPSTDAPRRHLHSDKWQTAKKKSYEDFINFLIELKAGEE